MSYPAAYLSLAQQRWKVLALLLLLQVPAGAWSADEPASRFQRTVLGLAGDSPDAKAEFAGIALTELAQVYMAEADLATSESREESSNRSKLLGWSNSVEQYAVELINLQALIEEGAWVELSLSPQGLVTVTVSRTRVMLTHPRARQQPAYEALVLADFCARRDCGAVAGATVAAEETPIPVSAGSVAPLWSFSGDGARCEYRGLILTLEGAGNLTWSRSLCEQLMQEAQLLQTEIAWQRLQGVRVNWVGLQAIATPGGRQYLLALNETGDSVLVAIPLIFSSRGLLRDLTPWLRGEIDERTATPLQLWARNYGWDKVEPAP